MKKYSLVYSKGSHFIELLIFIGLSILVCLISDQYLFNPFLLVLIYISYIRGINNYLFTVVISIITSLFISIPYGLEVGIINITFFFFCLLLCLFKKDSFFKRYGSFLLTNLFFMVFYLIRYFSLSNLINLSISFFVSCILLYGYLNFANCLIEEDKEFEGRAKVIVLTSLSLIFYGLNGLYLIIARLIHILICRTCSPIEGALAIILNCFILYYVQNCSRLILISLIVPSIICIFLNRKLVFSVYLFLYVIIYLYFSETFYKDPMFYQGLVSILISLIIPEKILDKIKDVFSREETLTLVEANQRLNEVSNSINDITSYLDIVLSNSIDTSYSPVDKMMNIVKTKVCKDCENRRNCSLYPIIKDSIEYEFSKDNKKILFDECLYPYKIIRQIRLNKVTLINEQKYFDEIKNKNDIYLQEIENIYKPLRSIFSSSEILRRKKSLLYEELEAYHYHLSTLSIGHNNMTFQIALNEKEDISKVLTIISNCMKKTYYLEDMFYILSLGLYQVVIVSKPLFKLDLHIISYGVNKDFNGDNYLSFFENNHYYLILSDGIGHNIDSSNISFFMVNALNAYRKIEEKVDNQIANINSLVKSKVNDEIYATLDYIDIDLIKGTMEIFKCGSFNSYLFRHNELIKFKSNTPPIGIIYNIKTSSLVKDLMVNDILIFMTDGYIQEPEDIIQKVLIDNFNESAQSLASLLNKELSLKQEINDDKTLVVIKFQTLKEFTNMSS